MRPPNVVEIESPFQWNRSQGSQTAFVFGLVPAGTGWCRLVPAFFCKAANGLPDSSKASTTGATATNLCRNTGGNGMLVAATYAMLATTSAPPHLCTRPLAVLLCALICSIQTACCAMSASSRSTSWTDTPALDGRTNESTAPCVFGVVGGGVDVVGGGVGVFWQTIFCFQCLFVVFVFVDAQPTNGECLLCFGSGVFLVFCAFFFLSKNRSAGNGLVL
eukprot:TRINITY_DN7833_c0_g1_i1.p2 TRINITY_DN7833_c0_g1~~TRINITY_DN7833_c0_g1_i1.p2  ORF type:complete len:242 (+),score=52.10 TRINITY_DN7833_c0_g1_i1:72-728(+)